MILLTNLFAINYFLLFFWKVNRNIYQRRVAVPVAVRLHDDDDNVINVKTRQFPT